MKKEKKTVRLLVVWILAAVIVLEGCSIVYLAHLYSEKSTANVNDTSLTDETNTTVTSDNEPPVPIKTVTLTPATAGSERQEMCNHFIIQPTGYSGINAYFVVAGDDGSETQYATPEDVLYAFSQEISKDIENPQEGAGKSVVATEYRYCPECDSVFEYGTLTITSYVETITVVSVKDFFDSEDYDKICHVQTDDGSVIYYCFRTVKDTVVQFFSDWWDALFNDAETEEYTVECLAFTMDEQALYTAEEYQEILNTGIYTVTP